MFFNLRNIKVYLNVYGEVLEWRGDSGNVEEVRGNEISSICEELIRNSRYVRVKVKVYYFYGIKIR